MAGPVPAPAAPAGPAGPGGGEDLLRMIRQLLEQYLAMGDQTPVAPEAQALAQAIDQAAPGAAGPEGPDMGGGVPPAGPGAPPPTGPLEGLAGDEELPPDNMLPQEGEPPRDTGKKSFASARGNAEKRLKKRNEKK
jgi:hypothetical protein